MEFYRDEYNKIYADDQRGEYRLGLNRHILDLIESLKGFGKILDVGTGLGFFLKDAQDRSWDVYGIEPSGESAVKAIELVGKKIFNGALNEYKEGGDFDAITFINVLDHLAEPWQGIKIARNQIKPQGLIYLRFPNGSVHTSILRIASRIGAANLISRYLVFHEFCFTKRYIKRLLSDSGFEKTVVANSVSSEGDPNRLFQSEFIARNIKKFVYAVTRFVYMLSAGKILLGVSLEVTAYKR